MCCVLGTAVGFRVLLHGIGLLAWEMVATNEVLVVVLGVHHLSMDANWYVPAAMHVPASLRGDVCSGPTDEAFQALLR
jgi:hypothetical protein